VAVTESSRPKASLRALDRCRRVDPLVPAARRRGVDQDADGRCPTGRTHFHRRTSARVSIIVSALFSLRSTLTEIDAPALLAFRWTWGPDFPYGGPADTDAVVEFRSYGAGTRVTLRHRGFIDPALRAAHEHGWDRCFEGMARLLAETADKYVASQCGTESACSS
jgi:hypothetical protein